MIHNDIDAVAPHTRLHYFYVSVHSTCQTSHWSTVTSDRRELNSADLREIERRMLEQATDFNCNHFSVDINPCQITYLGAMTAEEWNEDPYKKETPN